MQQLFSTLIIFGTFIASTTAGMQSIAVAGTLICGNTDRYPFAVVELWDKDTIDPDDLMANTTSGHDGGFFIQGKEPEITTIDPEIRIFHKCGDETVKCYKQTTIQIPDDFITDAEKPTKIYQASKIDLKALPNTETKICNN